MGQVIGRAELIEPVQPFVNLDRLAVYELWEAFNDIAEGFGLNVEEFAEICTSLQETVFADAPKAVILKAAEAMFVALDTDENLLVDALEVLVTLAMLSALEMREKANFCFTCYDFDESGEITIDEMILLLKSCASGLCKLSTRVELPEEAKLEQLAQEAFRKIGKSDDVKITRDEFVTYCTSTPEIVAWYNHYDNAMDYNLETLIHENDDEDLERETQVVLRKRTEMLAKHPDISHEQSPQVLGSKGHAWIETARHTVPSDVKPGDVKPELPDKHSLTLEWVYGYQAQEVRNNLAYSCTGEIVFTAACAGVVFNVEAHEQQFNLDHTDEIISMALHPTARLVATGERGPRPVINLWDASSLKLVSALKGYHSIGIQSVAFSPGNGTWLVSIGQDIYHSLALYDWNKRELLFSSRSTPSQVLDCKFRFFGKSSSKNTPPSFVTCGVEHIYFWNLEGNNSCKPGIFGRIGKLQTMICLACNEKDNRVVSGALSGHIYQWDQCRNLKRTVQAHDSSVTGLCFTPDFRTLVSAGKDGKVRMWSASKLEQGATFDIHGLGSLNSAVSTICIHEDGSKMLVGTRASEVFEMSMQDGCNLHNGPLVQAHCKDELHGLSIHPTKLEFVTVGDDRTVRIWDIEAKQQLRMVRVDTKARACAYSPDGKVIAIGLGGGDTSAKKEGAFAILNEADLTIIHEARDSKSAITDVKFSCDGQTLALASADRFVYLYNVEDYASIGKCKGHTGMLENVDFSEDSHNLQSCCSSKQLLFWNTETGEQLKKPSQLKDTVWASQNCTIGWPVKAAWMAESAIDVTACDRSKSMAIIACGDSVGRVRLFRFPAAADATPGFLEYHGHSSSIRRAQFSSTDGTLLTVGRRDRCILQWEHTVDEEEAEGGIFQAQVDSEDEGDLRERDELNELYSLEARAETCEPVASTVDPHHPAFIDDILTPVEKDDEADAAEEEAVPKPWLRAAIPSSNAEEVDESSPGVDLSIDWVYGFNGVDSRGSVRYLSNGEVVFPAASLAVVVNQQEHSQRFFTEHSHMTIALDVHPGGVVCATGELGQSPCVRIWDTETMQCLQSLAGVHTVGVNVVRFCSNGDKLLTAGLDAAHKVVVYDWANGAVVAHCQGGPGKVLDLSFLPDVSGFVQCGVDHLKFHWFNGRNIATQNAVLGTKGKQQTVYSLGWTGTRCVAGCADGQLYGFQGRNLQLSVKGHEGAVLCLWGAPEGIATGGKDGKVKLWTLTLEPKAQFTVESVNGTSSIRSLCWDVDRNLLLVATRKGDILELSGSDGQPSSKESLTQSHQATELWGLAAHPSKQEFVTGGDDRTVRVWDAIAHKTIKQTAVDTCVRAAAYAPDGSKIAIGLGGRTGKGRHKKDGAFIILSEGDLSVVHEGKDSKQWITVIEWSDDGATLAVGSFDACIYLYDVGGGFSLKGVFDGHNAFITSVDLSRNGQYMRSNCGADELMFCDANGATAIPAVSTMKDVAWSSTNCSLIWALKGLHSPQAAQTTAVCTNSEQTYAVSGTEHGLLSLRRFPTISPDASAKEYTGHCAAVQRARFLTNNSFVVTTGGKDRCAIQWKCEESDVEVPIEAGESGVDSEVALEQKSHSTATQRHLSAELVAMRPWFTSVVPPSSATDEGSAPTAPSVSLELSHVYGYRAIDVRNNLKYVGANKFVYFTSGVGIAYDKRSNSQILYQGHLGKSITCLDVHPNGHFVATGEEQYRTDDSVSVHVWDASTGRAVVILPAVHAKAVKYVAFSPCGKRLVSLAASENQMIFIWRSNNGTWDDVSLQASAMGGKAQLLFVHFSSSLELVTGGTKNICFWKLDGQLLRPTTGMFGRKGKAQPLLCACSVGSSGRVVSGTVTGHLYVWERAECVKSVKAHDKSVNCLHAARFAGIVSGSKDGVVKLWDGKLTPLRTFDMTEAFPVPHLPAIRSVCWDDGSGLVLVGTQGSDIYEITTENQSIVRISTAHAMDEVWGLAVHPTDSALFVTGGDDHTVRVWDSRLRLQLYETNVGCMVRCVAWSPDGKLISAGLGGNVGKGRQKKDGVVLVLNADDLSLAHELRDSREWISVVRFSPDGEILAVGSRDNKTYLYEATKNYVLRATCESHTSFITNLDFSLDSTYLRSNCGGFDLKFHKTEDGGYVQSPSTLKDVEWATDTCTLAWAVQGIWPEVTDKTHYNTCDRSHTTENKLLLSCDDEGKLHVFKYPCVVKGSDSVTRHVHTGPLIIARFSSTDKLVFSCGGPDRTICQWKVI